MTLWLISNMLLISFMSLLLCLSPLTMGLSILSIALMIAMYYSLICSSWYGFLIFLIYISGILVMFSYFVALTPNQPSMSMSCLKTYLMSLILLMIISMISNWSSMSISINSSYTQIMYQPENSSILFLLALTLLLIMIITVKVTHRSSGPLRTFMSYV